MGGGRHGGHAVASSYCGPRKLKERACMGLTMPTLTCSQHPMLNTRGEAKLHPQRASFLKLLIALVPVAWSSSTTPSVKSPDTLAPPVEGGGEIPLNVPPGVTFTSFLPSSLFLPSCRPSHLGRLRHHFLLVCVLQNRRNRVGE